MDQSLTTRVADDGFWREMWRQLRLVWYLLRSPDVPLYLKLLPLVAVIYVLIPTDFIPDVFPFIGQLDDITALFVGAKVFIELAPQEVVARHIQALRQQSKTHNEVYEGQEQPAIDDTIVIEGDFHHVDEKEEDQA